MRAEEPVLTPETTGLAQCLDRLASGKDRTVPLATYRIQFHRGFRFADARKLVAYLHALGISHLYSSPILKSRAGSMHGYDITDHNLINPEIGTPPEFEGLVRDLRQASLGVVLDFVPNHMGVGHGTNPWWQDVLENGQASQFANYFDIDWTPLKSELHGKVLLPILGGQYGEELEQGHIVLQYENGVFFCAYYDKRLPLDPQTYPLIFEGLEDLRGRVAEADWKPSGLADLEVLISAFECLPPHTTSEGEELQARQKAIPHLKQRLSRRSEDSPAVRRVIEESVQRCNGRPGDHRSFDTLHRLLEAQAYRLAHWRVSAEEINYRRFFDINDLVGLRMENPAVFAETHRLVRYWISTGLIDGLRLDHPDGLYNPVQYFARLQLLYAAARCCGPEPAQPTAMNGIEREVVDGLGRREWYEQAPFYVLVEKILEPGEELPQEWAVAGTVGYEFGNLVNGIFIDKRNERAFTALYHRFIGGPVDIDQLIYSAKKLILKQSLASEAMVLTHLLDDIACGDRYARDFTRHALLEAIRETIACFPVYRTYIDERGKVSEADRRFIEVAIARAKRRNEDTPGNLFDFIRDILLLRKRQSFYSAASYRKRLRFTLKFQQLTGPVMAKGLEDTACYVYNRLASENEVGSSPKEFGLEVTEFHAANTLRAHRWPDSMLSTSTHDSKRSEDVRARVNVLTEMSKVWATAVMRWRRLHKAKKRALSDGRAVPDRNEEYLLYQTLIGAWPLDAGHPPSYILGRDAGKDFVARVQQYMIKAVHEAKVNLSWTNQNPEYVKALEQFIARILQPGTSARPNMFLNSIDELLPKIHFFGCINSLAQTLLKLTCPGVPDIYQGQELWDFSLVDPDNRRPVDFEHRQRLLDQLQAAAAGDLPALCAGMVRSFTDGRLKLWTTVRALHCRREFPQVFRHGGYRPLQAEGKRSEHLVAFAREEEGKVVLAAVPRLAYTLCGGEILSDFSPCWSGTRLAVPENGPRTYENVFTGEILRVNDGALLCGELFAHFPVALLRGL